MPAALEVNWEEIKQYMMLSGCSFEEAATKYSDDQVEVTHWAIRKRAERELWPIPSRVLKKMREMEMSKAVQNEQISTATAEDWLQKGENHRALAFKVAKKAMETVSDAPPEVKDWSDVEKIDKMARRAAGLDNSETQINQQFNFGMLGMRGDVE